MNFPRRSECGIGPGFWPRWAVNFRIELSWAKLAGLAALLVPMVPARLKEWAYAGFAITLVSALIAHLAVGDGVEKWSWAVGTGVLWGVSDFFFRRLQAGAAAI